MAIVDRAFVPLAQLFLVSNVGTKSSHWRDGLADHAGVRKRRDSKLGS